MYSRTIYILLALLLVTAGCGPPATQAATPTPGPHAITYTYDDAGRLTRADYGGASIAYTYDNAGNLLSREVQAASGESPAVVGTTSPQSPPPAWPLAVLAVFAGLLLVVRFAPVRHSAHSAWRTTNLTLHAAKRPSTLHPPRSTLHTGVWKATVLLLILSLLMPTPALAGGAISCENPPCETEPITAGDTGGSTLQTGDPINAATGEYYFTMNWLNLGGSLPLDFSLFYGSLAGQKRYSEGLPHFNFFTNQRVVLVEYDVDAQEPRAIHVEMGLGREVGFYETQGGWKVFDSEATTYQLVETSAYYYLLDPVREWVYIFEKVKAIPEYRSPPSIVVLAFLIDRNGNTLTYANPQGADRVLRSPCDPKYGPNCVHIVDRIYSAGPDTVSDGLGRELRFFYGGEWRTILERVEDQNGRAVSFTIEKGDLQTITDPMGNVTTFQYADVPEPNYNSPAEYAESLKSVGLFVTSVQRPAGNVPYTQTYSPSQSGVVDSQTDAYGNTTQLNADEFDYSWNAWGDEYNLELSVSENSQFTVTYPDGAQRVFRHNRHARLAESATDPAGNTARYEADPVRDQIIAVTDRLDDTTSFTYHPETGKPASITNARGDTVSFTYAPQEQTFTNPASGETVTFTFYNLTRIDYPDTLTGTGGTHEESNYDERGNVTEYVDTAGGVWAYTYNERGQALTVTSPTGGVVTFTYNDDATLASRADSETGTTTFGYDDYKRLNQITHPKPALSGAEGGSSLKMAYDLNDHITSITDENGNTYAYEYDANGNLVKITDPVGQVSNLSYDLMDRVTQITDRLGNSGALAYDALGRLASLTDPVGQVVNLSYDPRGWQNAVNIGGQTWQTAYDAEGVPTADTTPLGNVTSYQTDALGLLAAVADPLGHTTTLTRDALNRITGITDPLGRATEYAYDSRGRLASVSPPGLGTAAYTRNELGLITGIADLNEQQWAFDYSPMGRLASAADPLGNTAQYAYDDRGRLITTTLADGAALSFNYDAAGNLTGLQDLSGLDLTYSYDALNRLTGANGIELAYDAEGRITLTSNLQTPNFGATYDAAGRVQTVTYGDAFTVTYAYDPATALLVSVTDSLTNSQIEFTYDADRRLVGVQRSNGVNTELQWDAASRLTGLKDLLGLDTLLDLQYTLDAAGQVTGAQMTAPLDPASNFQLQTSNFQYDAASQLAGDGYAYDAQGRLTKSPDGEFKWDALSRLVGIGDTALTYNALGDLTTRRSSDQATTGLPDYTTNYHYNYALGLTPIVAEQDADQGEFLRYYVWTPAGQLLYMIDAARGNAVYFYHFDRVGSTLALTDKGGAVADAYAYTPYGRLLQHEGDSEQPFTFVGQWGVRQEGASGDIYHMRARYYDAVTARFLTREPLWPATVNPKQVNPYQFALENPLKYIDPTGLDPVETDSVLIRLESGDWVGELSGRRYSDYLEGISGEVQLAQEMAQPLPDLVNQRIQEAVNGSFSSSELSQEIEGLVEDWVRFNVDETQLSLAQLFRNRLILFPGTTINAEEGEEILRQAVEDFRRMHPGELEDFESRTAPRQVEVSPEELAQFQIRFDEHFNSVMYELFGDRETIDKVYDE